ncbi:YceI family protein [Lutibacter sp.]|uniref:YceI family protein n=1 Tax=Lutibacter sp. TaxID=1925666 RepID=UPI002736C2E9|nr:YceI family protein [Lutibacter sp.]MDP3314305.1 YceI family protein [Lutibacter sp.]
MKKIGLLIITIAFVSMAFTTAKKENITKTSNVTSSTIKWKGYKPTGSHSGTIQLASGKLEIDGEKLKGGSFVADMSTIKDDDGNARLEGHLKNQDFFEVDKYPTSTFVITSVSNIGSKTMVTGDLTIKDVTKSITFPATVEVKSGVATLTSDTFKINRAHFNVKYQSKSFFDDLKDKFVDDDFDLQVIIVAKV